MMTALLLAATLTGLDAALPARTTPAWYNDARFGIFCHWGPQCQPEAGGNWYGRSLYFPSSNQGKYHRKTYGDPKDFGFKDILNIWKAENWNPDELCALYRRMGATFILAMANHHDNFDLWDSRYQPWNSVNMGPKRDILKGWSEAARKAGLRFGISVHASRAWSWFEPARDYDGLLTKEDGKGTWWEGYDPQMLYWQNHEPSADYRNPHAPKKPWDMRSKDAKLPSKECRENFRLRTMDAIVRYKPDIVYWDDVIVPFWPLADEGMRIVADFYALNPDAIVLGKCLNEAQRRWLTWDLERGTPTKPMYPKWQTDTCIGDWHYNRDRLRTGYRSARDVIRQLVDVVSKNGNFCLSIPIRGDGTIDEKERAICEEIAAWMAENRVAIFDSDPYEICGEGPQLAKTPPLRAQGFNENKLLPPTKADVRYMKARGGKGVYAFELAPDGRPPVCPALEAKGLRLVKSFAQLPGFPALHLFGDGEDR